MMKCIEVAVKDGFITKEQGRDLQKQVDDLLEQGLGPDHVRSKIVEGLAADAKERKRRALLMEARRKVLTEIVLNHKNAKGQNDPAEALWLLLDDTSGQGISGVETKRLAILGDAHSQIDQLLHDFRKGWFTGDARRKQASVRASLDNYTREMFGEKTGDPRAKELAEAVGKVFETLRTRANAAGMRIGKLESFGLPQGHNREALLTAGQGKWVDYMMQPGRLDLDRMVSPLTQEKLSLAEMREGLMEAWKTITSDGWIARNPSYAGLGKGALAKRHDDRHRWIHFASADEWMAYQKQFGEGDPHATTMAHISRMSRDIATLEVLGPDPEAMRNYLKSLVMKTAASVEPVERVLSETMGRLRNMVDATGTGEAGRLALDKIEFKIAELAKLKRQARAAAGGGKAEMALAAQVEKQLNRLTRELGELESATTQQRRGILEAEITRLDGLAEFIEGKLAPQLGGNARARMEKLRQRQAELDAETAAVKSGTDARTSRLVEDLYAVLKVARENPGGGWDLDAVHSAIRNMLREDLPKPVWRRLMSFYTSKDQLIRELEALEAGGMIKARLEEIDAARRDVTREMDVFTVSSGMSRRNRRRLQEIARDKDAIQRQIDALDLDLTTIADANPKGYRQMLALIRAAIDAGDKVDVVGDPQGFLSVSKPQDAARTAIAKFDSLWELHRGTYFAPVNTTFANVMQTGRNLMTAHMLGSASITAIADIATQHTARKFAGMNGNLVSIVAGVVGQWSHASRAEAVRAGLILDEAMHVGRTQARYVEAVDTVNWSGYIADRVLAYSGLSWMTQAGKHAFGLEFMGHMAEHRRKTWHQLPKWTEDVLRRNGFSALDWDLMRHVDLHEPRPGATFLRPNEIAQGPGGEALAERYLQMVIRLTRKAVVEGTPEARVFWGGGRPGTFIGEVSRGMAQFKTFGVSYIMTHLRDIQHQWQRGQKRDAVGHAATLAGFGTIMGALAIELQAITSGNDPRITTHLAKGEMPGAKYWGEAFMKAGGFGIWGDFLFASTHAAGGGAMETLAGPLFGTAERIRKVGLQEIKEDKAPPLSRYAIRTAESVTPGTSLWFLKGLIARGVFDQMTNAWDPGAKKVFAGIEGARKKEKGNDSWWKRGELLPQRAPSFTGTPARSMAGPPAQRQESGSRVGSFSTPGLSGR